MYHFAHLYMFLPLVTMRYVSERCLYYSVTKNISSLFFLWVHDSKINFGHLVKISLGQRQIDRVSGILSNFHLNENQTRISHTSAEVKWFYVYSRKFVEIKKGKMNPKYEIDSSPTCAKNKKTDWYFSHIL